MEQANPQIADPNVIYVGQAVNVPEGAASAVQQASAPATSPSSIAGAYSSTSSGGGIPGWATCIVQRESGGDPTSVNSIPGYIGNGGGLFGNLTSTWDNHDGYHQPFQAPVSVQIAFNDQLSGNGANLSPWAADGCPGT